MLIHYLVKDEPQASRFQSGLFQNSRAVRSSRRSRSRSRSRRPAAAAASSSSGVRSGPARGVQTYRVQVRTGRRLALQRRDAQDERARVLQRRRSRRPGRQRADLLAAGRRLQRHDPRPLERLRAATFRACGRHLLFHGGFASRVAWLVTGLFLCAVRHRLLPRVRARPAAVGRAPPGARRAARDLASAPRTSSSPWSCSLLVWRLRRADRAGDAPERDPRRLVRDRPDGDRRRRRALGGVARRPDRADRGGARLLRRRLGLLHLRVARRRAARLADARHVARPRLRIGAARTGLELAALVVGFLLGGTVGIGTLVFAVGIGPVVEVSFWLLGRTPLAAPAVASSAA